MKINALVSPFFLTFQSPVKPVTGNKNNFVKLLLLYNELLSLLYFTFGLY